MENREIKFRAFSKETKKMMDWNFIKTVGNLNKLLTLNHVVVMQFTGLKDKNEVEIYEGDIINCSRNGFLSGNFTNIPSIVKWSSSPYSAWEAHPIRNEEQEQDEEYGVYSHYTFGAQIFSSDCEVIGNIHENPELP